MPSILRAFLDRCARGFTLRQKWWFTLAGVVYWFFPIDCIPDVIPVLGWCDDWLVAYLIYKVWAGPTNSPPRAGRTPHIAVIPPQPAPSLFDAEREGVLVVAS